VSRLARKLAQRLHGGVAVERRRDDLDAIARGQNDALFDAAQGCQVPQRVVECFRPET